MSEPRRWWVLAEHHQTPLLSESKPDAPEECLFRVIEAEPVEKRIKDLEARLAEANAVAEFYGNKSHWMDNRIHPDDVELMRTEMNDPGGKRARQYLEKYKERKS